MDTKTKKAIELLNDANPLRVKQPNWFFALTDFYDTHGKDGIFGLAGFLVWASEYLKEPERQDAITECFNHDISGRNDETMLPRSDDYKQYYKP